MLLGEPFVGRNFRPFSKNSLIFPGKVSPDKVSFLYFATIDNFDILERFRGLIWNFAQPFLFKTCLEGIYVSNQGYLFRDFFSGYYSAG